MHLHRPLKFGHWARIMPVTVPIIHGMWRKIVKQLLRFSLLMFVPPLCAAFFIFYLRGVIKYKFYTDIAHKSNVSVCVNWYPIFNTHAPVNTHTFTFIYKHTHIHMYIVFYSVRRILYRFIYAYRTLQF